MLICSLIFSILICFGIPILGFLIIRKQQKGIGRAFLVGMLTFTVSQVCLRIPILTYVLPNFMWFNIMQMDIFISGLFLGGTAALFEEGARWISMRFLLKDRYSLYHGLAFGLGHGGIEAILLVGINMLVYLVMVLTGNGSLTSASAGNIFMGGVERVSAIAFHIGASLIIMYGFSIGKSLRGLAAAFLLHTIFDASVVILSSQYGVDVVIIEVIIAVFGLLVLLAGLYLYKRERLKQEYSI